MSYTTLQSNYREMEIHAASPEKLLCIVFEQLVVNLERARIAIERKDVELRVVALRRARGLVTELLTTLDVEKGGPLGVELAGMYQVMLVELVDVGMRGDLKVMRQLVNIATQLRDGFVGAERQLAAQRLKTA
ncbi:MAG TPA: flagellar export chaperone FliS [Gemmatimonas aurantiaca]|uniref:Flagellar protein FliS n=2 Tax=Gemmatimonas aurantiaca TaxID=173480 RepID=C1A586_GEMAT|nr:flagellar export chaperone FliS [Gemmatimonas aurantiaca]BAH37396.1 flagellar protein FliS [Gemmatimonas aurantiaca T-27]HCT55812.1 flagellar export chaperone FliS [Gemmatimonas aurantiaca]